MKTLFHNLIKINLLERNKISDEMKNCQLGKKTSKRNLWNQVATKLKVRIIKEKRYKSATVALVKKS